ncbi:MAG: protein tyrosine phosphatase family protein [Pseudomonadota bacterium]
MTKVEEIINWRQINERITTSGQPTEAEFAAIKNSGVSVVINLGPHSNRGALMDEPGTLADLGLEYIYIPVDFENPTDDDFDKFCAAMDRTTASKVHVHCIYNARVSAFFYRYATEGRGGSADEAFSTMDGIWRPGGVWADFIGKPEDRDQPNRFLGYEY